MVTKPFTFKRVECSDAAEEADKARKKRVDTPITIPNERLFQIVDKKTSVIEAFKFADDVLRQGVQGISDLNHHYRFNQCDLLMSRRLWIKLAPP